MSEQIINFGPQNEQEPKDISAQKPIEKPVFNFPPDMTLQEALDKGLVHGVEVADDGKVTTTTNHLGEFSDPNNTSRTEAYQPMQVDSSIDHVKKSPKTKKVIAAVAGLATLVTAGVIYASTKSDGSDKTPTAPTASAPANPGNPNTVEPSPSASASTEILTAAQAQNAKFKSADITPAAFPVAEFEQLTASKEEITTFTTLYPELSQSLTQQHIEAIKVTPEVIADAQNRIVDVAHAEFIGMRDGKPQLLSSAEAREVAYPVVLSSQNILTNTNAQETSDAKKSWLGNEFLTRMYATAYKYAHEKAVAAESYYAKNPTETHVASDKLRLPSTILESAFTDPTGKARPAIMTIMQNPDLASPISMRVVEVGSNKHTSADGSVESNTAYATVFYEIGPGTAVLQTLAAVPLEGKEVLKVDDSTSEVKLTAAQPNDIAMITVASTVFNR